MAQYIRDIPHERECVDELHAAILDHPRKGITVEICWKAAACWLFEHPSNCFWRKTRSARRSSPGTMIFLMQRRFSPRNPNLLLRLDFPHE
jgi:hypothetical protein